MIAPFFHAFAGISAIAGGALAASIWQGIVLAICVSICLRLLPGISAAARSLVWMGVFLAVLLFHFAPLAGHGTATASVAPGAQLHVDPRWALLLAAAWIALSLFRATQFVLSANHLRKVKQRATPIACNLAQQSGSRRYTVCTSSDTDRPSVVGFFSPRVLLPPSLVESLSAQELQQVLLHETEHLRRRDDWTNLLQKLALVLFPLNPVLFWIERRLCLERELACDDRVLGETGARKVYATCLTHLAEQSVLRRRVSLALGAWERRSELTRRVHRILRQPQAVMGQRTLRFATGIMMAGLLAGGLALARSPQLLSFSPRQQFQHPQAASVDRYEISRAAFRPVSAPRERAASATLVRAVMPQPSRRGSTSLFGSPKRVSRPKSPVLRSQTSSAQPRILRTEWRFADDGPRLMLTVASQVSYTFVPAVERVPAYAAVPVSNGWIIFQL